LVKAALAVPSHVLLARLAPVLEEVGVGIGICGMNGAVDAENAAMSAALVGRKERVAGELALVLEGGSPGAGPWPLATIPTGWAIPIDTTHALVLVGAAGRLPTLEEVRAAFGLSRREAEVALLLARRASTREIATTLNVSPHTARHHAERALHKLGVRTRSEVAGALCSRSET
jgi:DNA-binding CsgD family transcriptional regulator